MTKSWRSNVAPHDDVLSGSFQQAEFAADITLVHEHKARPEYQDPKRFFERTYITEGMRMLLTAVVKRLNGEAADPVIQLQTGFGGGKTHTMLAVRHLVGGEASPRDLAGIPPLLDAAGFAEVPTARVVVIDGIRYSASQPMVRDGQRIHTLWGDLAWQLGKAEAYAMVAADDAAGTSPGKAVLTELLARYEPCVVLIDELVAYIRQFDGAGRLSGGTFESNLTFIQALTESVKAVPRSILLASLPEAEQELGASGTRVASTVQHYFGRLHAIWKPVDSEEAFEIVRRRLFERVNDPQAAREVCKAFAATYAQHRDDLPPEVQQASYLERMVRAYPIHPELFDRLYEDWATLENFQRTRGVLRLMARIVHRLWKDGSSDALILPGSIPLNDQSVRADVVYYLPTGWESVIVRDIDGETAEATQQDMRNERLGSLHACRRVARAIFMGSAPGSGNNPTARGVEEKQALLGVLQPGEAQGVYKDGLKRLVDRLHHINAAGNRYWFDKQPNLRREMEGRRSRFTLAEHMLPALKERLQRLLPNGPFGGVHVFTQSGDIQDDWALRLVVLPPGETFSRSGHSKAVDYARETLEHRGEQPRVKQNRLLFLAADADAMMRLTDQMRALLAWQDIVRDSEAARLTMDQHQMSQAKQQRDMADQVVTRTLRDTYRWLLVPHQPLDKKGAPDKLEWESHALGVAKPTVTAELEHTLKENELLITEWAPIHLSNLLKQWFWTPERREILTHEIWQKMANYLYMPRLQSDQVFKNTISIGVRAADFFGLAQGKDGDQHLGFVFEEQTTVFLDSQSLLLEPELAKQIRAERLAEKALIGRDTTRAKYEVPIGSGQAPDSSPATPSVKAAKTQFVGSTYLKPVGAAIEFSTIMDEIVGKFMGLAGVDVEIHVEVRASSKTGFSDQTTRAVREDCNTLRFKGEFE